uniref:Uncharacterized protein n=1 Tax=Timema bartmani TaxID=61472 RepID=A0A7R9FDB0_9NEOP|nr:unnamed protein product [Timema bartmani]
MPQQSMWEGFLLQFSDNLSSLRLMEPGQVLGTWRSW